MIRHGVTLVELIVVLAILGLIGGVTGLAMHRAAPVPVGATWRAIVAGTRRTALDSARAVTVTVVVDGVPHAVTASPDGRVIADSAIRVDPLSGAPNDAP